MLFLTLSALLLSPAHAAKGRVVPDVVEDALAFATTDRDRAVNLLEQALAEASPADRDVVELYLVEQLRLAGSADAGVRAEALAGRASGGDRDAARLGAALVAVEDGELAQLTVLREIDEKAALGSQNADRYLFLAVAAAREGDAKSAGALSKKALAYAKEDPTVKARVEDALARLARGEAQPEPTAETTGDLLAKAEEAWAAGDREKAASLAKRAAAASEGAEKARAEGLVRALAGAVEDPRKIVVLVPMSGKYEAVGKQVRDALGFGFGSASATLEYVDSGASPETAVAALEKAVLEDGAIAVVGPMLSDETEAVLAKAEELHVPLLSLSQSYEDTTGHHWALQSMYSRGDQIAALLDWVTKEKGMDAFAVFNPDNDFGTRAAERFAKEVAARGGSVVTSATYAAESTNLGEFARKLGAREGNLAQLRAEAVKNGGNPNTVVVPPRIDFDAIFIPESSARTPLVCAALAYEEFPMGDFVPRAGGVKVPLLGLSSWNNTQLVTQGNEYTRGSFFPDVFSAAVAGETDPFVVEFRKAAGHAPIALEAAVVDVGRLLAATVAQGPTTRPAFREAALKASVPDAVTGATHIDPETLRANRKMLILTITRNGIDDVGTVPIGD
jgi:branched-chain amino acid transport system substrate-binding protein